MRSLISRDGSDKTLILRVATFNDPARRSRPGVSVRSREGGRGDQELGRYATNGPATVEPGAPRWWQRNRRQQSPDVATTLPYERTLVSAGPDAVVCSMRKVTAFGDAQVGDWVGLLVHLTYRARSSSSRGPRPRPMVRRTLTPPASL